MPARKEKTKKQNNIDFSKRKEIFKNSESYKSLFYGIVAVMVIFILGAFAVRLLLNHPKGEVDDHAASVTGIDEALREARASGSTYIVQENESLWDVAVKKYNDGYKWVEIARVNNISDPDTIFKGDKLIIPAITGTPIIPKLTITPTPTLEAGTGEQVQKITLETYTVKAGDDLWDVAVRSYGDGYKWVDIAAANNLTDPNLIFSGNVLTIPRQ